MMLPSRLGCPMNRKTPYMGNTGLAMYQKVEGEMVRATVFAKFWSGPEDSP